MNGRKLKGISGNGKTISYNYNDEGIRTSKTVNGVTTTYYLEGTKVIYETTGSNTTYYLYDNNDNIIGLIYNNTTYYYQKNGQNDIIGLLDSNYNKLVNYEYDSWGKLISIKDNNGNPITSTSHIGIINPYRYRSYRYDTETGYYYLQSRYYNPEWGRFINADAYGGQIGELLTHNGYQYSLNNPINNIDPTGYYTIKELWDYWKKGIKVMGEKIKNIFSSNGGVKKADALVLAGTAAAIDGPLPIGDVVALVILSFALSYPDVMPAEATKVGTEINSTPCTTATLVLGDVQRGDRLTIPQAVTTVDFGGNVMCDNKIAALAVASAFPGYYLDPPHGDVTGGYYPHFHPWNGKGHPHIWFYPTS